MNEPEAPISQTAAAGQRRSVLTTSAGTLGRVHRARLGALLVDRRHLGIVVPVHRDRAPCVRARVRHLAPGRPRRLGALARARRQAAVGTGGCSAARGPFGAVGRDPLHALPTRRAADLFGPHRSAQRRAAHLRGRHRLADAAETSRPNTSHGAAARVLGDRRHRGAPIAEGSSAAIGVAMGLSATVCYGVAINIAAPLTQRYGGLPVMARMLGLAAVWTTPLGLLSLRGSTFTWPSFLSVTALGIMGTGIAFVLMGRLVSRVGSTRASFATYLIPVVALLLGVVFLSERVHLLSIAGIALVILGAVIASRKERSA